MDRATRGERLTRHLERLGPLMLLLSLCTLWFGRGANVTGWEILGAADTAYAIHAQGLLSTIQKYWSQMSNYNYWTVVSAPFASILAGLFSTWFPWVLWPQLLMGTSSFVAFYLFAKSLKISPSLFYLAIAASGPLVTHMIVGHPYIAGTFAYMLAISWVLSRRHVPLNLRQIAVEALFWAFTYYVALNFYEAGRSFLIVPAVAAVTLSNVTILRRLFWIGVTPLLWFLIFKLNSHSIGIQAPVEDIPALIKSIPESTSLLAIVFLSQRLDFPFLLTLAPIGLIFVIKRDRLFWASLYLINLGTLYLVCQYGLLTGDVFAEQLRPRRSVIFFFICATIVSIAAQSGRTRVRYFFVSSLFIGALVVFGNAAIHFFAPIPTKALPFMDSEADFFVSRPVVRYSKVVSDFVRETPGRHLFLYGYSTYSENSTDPAALPERVMLELGPQMFDERVKFINPISNECRYSCLPMNPIWDLERILLESSSEEIFIHLPPGSYVSLESADEELSILSTSYRKFFPRNQLSLLEISEPHFSVYRFIGPFSETKKGLDRRGSSILPGKAGICIYEVSARTIGDLLNVKPSQLHLYRNAGVLPPGMPYRSQSIEGKIFSGRFINERPREVKLSIEIDNEIFISVDGHATVSYAGWVTPDGRIERSFSIPVGEIELIALYTNLGGPGLFDLRLTDNHGEKIELTCPRMAPEPNSPYSWAYPPG